MSKTTVSLIETAKGFVDLYMDLAEHDGKTRIEVPIDDLACIGSALDAARRTLTGDDHD